MISFRYHVVTIVAVFLALGLGVLMGTTVVKQSVINTLRAQSVNAINANHDLQKTVGELRTQVQQWERAGRDFQHLLVQGQLEGRTVVVLTAEGVDFTEVDGVRKALTDAGAAVSGLLAVTSRMGLAQDGPRVQLAELLGLPQTTDPQELTRQAALMVADRLANGPPALSGSTDILAELSGAGFVVNQSLGQGGLQAVGGPGQAVIVLSGGNGQPATDPAAFFVPLVGALVQASRPVVAGETLNTTYEFVSLLRKDGSIDGQAVTVDDADTMPGRVALVLALQGLLADGAAGCRDFGFKSGSCDVVPAPSPTP